MRKLRNTSTIAVLLLAFPIAALADLSGTSTLSANTALNLDTGATAASGGDILWNGSSITPQGSATAYNLPAPMQFDSIIQQIVQAIPSMMFSKTAIPASALTANDVFFVKTNGGNYAAVMVTGVSGTSITLQ